MKFDKQDWDVNKVWIIRLKPGQWFVRMPVGYQLFGETQVPFRSGEDALDWWQFVTSELRTMPEPIPDTGRKLYSA